MVASLLLFFAIAFQAKFLVRADDDQSLTFLIIGDWGKGGTTGAYTSSLDDNSNNQAPTAPEDDDDDDSGRIVAMGGGGGGGAGGGGGGGGGGNKLNQVQIAAAMGTRAASMQTAPSFIIALGDNFYTKGVSSSSDSLWNYLWKDVYLVYESLNIPWLPVFGNHDYGYGLTGVKAQLQRFQDHTDDDTWIFPSTNYTKVFPIPGSQDTVAIVFVDTTTLAPSENDCCNSKSGISSSTQMMLINDQLQHIENMLINLTTSENPPTWLLMAGHYPVYSVGEHGDTDELVQYLQPLIEKYNVDAYYCGHDHISEHLQYGSTHYFVAGAGSMTDKLGNSNSQANLIWYGVGYSAFAVGEASSSSLTVSFVDTSNTVTYAYTISKLSFSPSPEPASIPPTSKPTKISSVFPSVPSRAPVIQTFQSPEDSSSGRGVLEKTWDIVREETARRPIFVASGGVIMVGMTALLCTFASYRRAKKKKSKASTLYPSKGDLATYTKTGPTTSDTPMAETPSRDENKAMSTEIYHARSLSSGDQPGTWSFIGNTHSLVSKDTSRFEDGGDDEEEEGIEDAEEGSSKTHGGFMHQLAVQKLQLSVDTKNFRNVRYHRGSLAAIHTTYPNDLLSSLPPPESAKPEAIDSFKHHLRRATVASILSHDTGSKSMNNDHGNAKYLTVDKKSSDSGLEYAEIVDIYGSDDNKEIFLKDCVLRV